MSSSCGRETGNIPHGYGGSMKMVRGGHGQRLRRSRTKLQTLSPDSGSDASFLLVHILGGGRRWLGYCSDPCHPHGRPGVSSSLLVPAWPSLGYCGQRVNQWVKDPPRSLCPSPFKQNENKEISSKWRKKDTYGVCVPGSRCSEPLVLPVRTGWSTPHP